LINFLYSTTVTDTYATAEAIMSTASSIGFLNNFSSVNESWLL